MLGPKARDRKMPYEWLEAEFVDLVVAKARAGLIGPHSHRSVLLSLEQKFERKVY